MGAFHRPVNALPSAGNAFQFVVLGQPGTPERFEKAGFLPIQKVLVPGFGAAKAFSRERLGSFLAWVAVSGTYIFKPMRSPRVLYVTRWEPKGDS
jgi:hypothetical protein